LAFDKRPLFGANLFAIVDHDLRSVAVDLTCVNIIGNLLIAMTRPTATDGFKFNHTMIRVKDPQASIKWYQEVFIAFRAVIC